MGTICWVCFFSSSVTECGLWCWPYSLRVTLSLPPHRGTLKYWDYRNMTIFWKNLIVVTPMGYYPWTQNVFLGHWFHNVLGIPLFSYFVSQSWVQWNIHLLSHIGTAPSLSSSARSCFPFQLFHSTCCEDSFWVALYMGLLHRFMSW